MKTLDTLSAFDYIGIAAVVVAAVLIIFAFTIYRDLGLQIYTIGFLLLTGALTSGIYLNPRDEVGHTWTDPYFQGLSILGFLSCLVGPLFSRVRATTRTAFFGLGLLLTIIPFWNWYAATA